MYSSRGISNYMEVTMQSITPERMIVMLYEGIFRFLGLARQATESKDVESRVRNINKAQAIISELKSSLNHDCGATFTADLESLYNYAYSENTEFLIDHDPRHVDNVIRVLTPLYESWKAVSSGDRSGRTDEDRHTEDSGPKPASRSAESTRSGYGKNDNSPSSALNAETGGLTISVAV